MSWQQQQHTWFVHPYIALDNLFQAGTGVPFLSTLSEQKLYQAGQQQHRRAVESALSWFAPHVSYRQVHQYYTKHAPPTAAVLPVGQEHIRAARAGC